jgi:HD-GYP domain-containing protein (c-di-GMP phosphodiesterase class II)
VADIFQALAQSRPYREGMQLVDILEYLRQRVEDGVLDAEVVSKLAENSDRYYELAQGDCLMD